MSQNRLTGTWSGQLRGASNRRTPRWQLRLIHPRGTWFSLPLGVEPTTLGRGNSGDHPPGLPLAYVSRQHLVLSWQEGVRMAVEQGSTNGTWLDGMRLHDKHPIPMPEFSILRVLDAILIYEQLPSVVGQDLVTSRRIPGATAQSKRLRVRLSTLSAQRDPGVIVGPAHSGRTVAAHVVAELRKHACEVFHATDMTRQAEHVMFDALARHGTTVVLRDVENLAPDVQVKLREAVRLGTAGSLICTACTSLQQHSLDEQFDRELYLHIARTEIHVPTLKSRRGDIVQWIDHLHLRRPATAQGSTHRAPLAFTGEAIEAMLLHPWPDNIGQLQQVVRTLSAKSTGEPLTRGVVFDALDQAGTEEVTQETTAPFAA